MIGCGALRARSVETKGNVDANRLKYVLDNPFHPPGPVGVRGRRSALPMWSSGLQLGFRPLEPRSCPASLPRRSSATAFNRHGAQNEQKHVQERVIQPWFSRNPPRWRSSDQLDQNPHRGPTARYLCLFGYVSVPRAPFQSENETEIEHVKQMMHSLHTFLREISI